MKFKFDRADIQSSPFPHFFIEKIFPDELYRHMLKHIPLRKYYKKSGSNRTTNQKSLNHRVRINITEGIEKNALTEKELQLWSFIGKAVGSQEFSDIIKNIFQKDLTKRYNTNKLKTKTRIELISDENGYSISPHTDGSHKVATLLFYMPVDTGLRKYGTSIYQPKDISVIDERGTQFPFEMFHEVRQTPFIPNSVLGFIKTNNSFHGRPLIEHLNQPRNWMNCSIQHSKMLIN